MTCRDCGADHETFLDAVRCDHERLDAEAFAIACHRLGIPAEYWSRALAAAEEHLNATLPPNDGSRA